jgi:hypothetical protein
MAKAGCCLLIKARSGPKTPSKAQSLCCKPLQNAHILPCMMRFFVGPRPRVGGITHLIILIKVCLLSLNVICIFEIASSVASHK